MIIQESPNQIETNLNSKVVKGTILANGKAFKALSKNLYSDAIGSIIREISSNARDSHVQAGKSDVPFDITLPDVFEPYFICTDFGVGMSNKTVTEVFSSYFNSTKDKENQSIGGFGLGSKSPFSYTDTITLTSSYDGVQCVYAAYMNDEGLNIQLMQKSSVNTDLFPGGTNGVSFKIPVKSQDFENFKQKTKSQLEFFKVKPNIKNAQIEWSDSVKEEYTDESGNSLSLIQGSKHNPLYNDLVVMGGVKYTLNHSQSSELGLYGFNSACKVKIEVPIGSVEVSLSRESLEFNEKTKAYLSNVLMNCKGALNNQILSASEKFSCSLEKFEYLSNLGVKLNLDNNPVYTNQGFSVLSGHYRKKTLSSVKLDCLSTLYRSVVCDINEVIFDDFDIKYKQNSLKHYLNKNPKSVVIKHSTPLGSNFKDEFEKVFSGVKFKDSWKSIREIPVVAPSRSTSRYNKTPTDSSFNKFNLDFDSGQFILSTGVLQPNKNAKFFLFQKYSSIKTELLNTWNLIKESGCAPSKELKDLLSIDLYFTESTRRFNRLQNKELFVNRISDQEFISLLRNELKKHPLFNRFIKRFLRALVLDNSIRNHSELGALNQVQKIKIQKFKTQIEIRMFMCEDNIFHPEFIKINEHYKNKTLPELRSRVIKLYPEIFNVQNRSNYVEMCKVYNSIKK
jgi:hypothetical protein